MQEMVLKENGGVEAGGDELGMELLGNGSGVEGCTGFHGFIEFLG